jgi:nitrite reductase/ring-hydroxylating ferredoxin subunit
MKEVVVHENLKVLLVKDMNGEVTAIGTKCSHYGAPLIKGALGDGRVRCPWHGACFNTKTGMTNKILAHLCLELTPKMQVTLRTFLVSTASRVTR